MKIYHETLLVEGIYDDYLKTAAAVKNPEKGLCCLNRSCIMHLPAKGERMSSREDIVRDFIQKVSEIHNSREDDKSISSSELKQIALETGLSAEDWTHVQQAQTDYVKRGQGFLSLKNYDDAMYEYQQAHILQPDDVDSLFGLAAAYAGRYQQNGLKDDREAAEKYARMCLQISPDHRKALELISRMKIINIPRKRKTSLYIAIGISIAALAGVLLAFLTFQ